MYFTFQPPNQSDVQKTFKTRYEKKLDQKESHNYDVKESNK